MPDLPVSEDRIVGRLTGGDLTDLTGAQAMQILEPLVSLLPLGLVVSAADSDNGYPALFSPSATSDGELGAVGFHWNPTNTKIELVQGGYVDGEVYTNWVASSNGTTKTAYNESGAEDDTYSAGVFAQSLAQIDNDGTDALAHHHITTYDPTKVIGIYLDTGSCFLDISETTAPTATANHARLYCVDNGGGKTKLMCQFGSGSPVQVAIEP